MKFADVIDTIFKLKYLVISGECTLEEASDKVARNPHARGIYVVDDKERILGYLSLGVFFRQGDRPGIENLSGVRMADEYLVRGRSCYGCPIACGRATRPPRYGLDRVDGPEY